MKTLKEYIQEKNLEDSMIKILSNNGAILYCGKYRNLLNKPYIRFYLNTFIYKYTISEETMDSYYLGVVPLHCFKLKYKIN